jgi:hypothetical protein
MVDTLLGLLFVLIKIIESLKGDYNIVKGKKSSNCVGRIEESSLKTA